MPELLFSLLHPTVRTNAWKDAADQWLRRCDHPEFVEYVLVPERANFANLNLNVPFANKVVEYNQYAATTVGGSNYAAAISHGKVLILAADDFFPAPHWDTSILDLLRGKLDQEAVVWVGTGIQSFDNPDDGGGFMSFPIMTRAYYKRKGYMFWPEYTSYYADADFTRTAQADKAVEVIDARNIVQFKHVRGGLRGHYVNDAHYLKHGKNADFSGNLYSQRQAAGFPI